MAKKTDDKLKTILVPVDASKLSQGLKAAFMGIAMVFDSIGAGEAALELEAAAEETPSSEDAVETRQEDTGGADIVESTGSAENGLGNKQEYGAEDASKDKQETVSTVTVDDITKVIVAKIKQKRSNNEKIGQLLKTYGVDRVSSLPAEKYEAFLTDISQL